MAAPEDTFAAVGASLASAPRTPWSECALHTGRFLTSAAWFLWKRLTIAVVVAALLFGPLLTTDGELVFLNAVGLGIGALLLRRFLVRRTVRRFRR